MLGAEENKRGGEFAERRAPGRREEFSGRRKRHQKKKKRSFERKGEFEERRIEKQSGELWKTGEEAKNKELPSGSSTEKKKTRSKEMRLCFHRVKQGRERVPGIPGGSVS